MAEQKFSETLFEALDIIINKRLQSVQKDKTILCVIEDASKANEGEYVVSNASARFVAYSENTSYKNGQNVWVLIPEGDYNNEKQIISKHAGDSNTPYIYVDPMETYADMTGPIFADILSARHGLIANYSEPLSLFTGDEDEFQPLPNVENYTRMGIKADFQTDFGSADVIGGSYGLAFLIKTTKKIATTENGKDESQEKAVHFYIPVQCDTADMWGNPYAYNIPFTQSFCFDINQEEYGVPTGILGFFYQNSDFITSSGMLPYKISGEYTEDEDGVLVDPNIFVENIEISFGYSIDEVSDDTVYLFTKNALTYTVNDNSCKKTMQVRCIYVSDDMTRYAINSWSDFKNKINPDNDDYDATFAALNPSLHWYRYVRQEGVSDAIAGDFWEEIERDPDSEDNLFEYTVNDLNDLEDERFKVVLCYEPNQEEGTSRRWKSQNEYIHSNTLIFTNSDNPYDVSRDLEQALRLSVDEAPYGVYNLYKADYSANNNLDDSSDKDKPRHLKTNFYTMLDKTERMSDVTRVAWYIPKHNTMITRPALNRGYTANQWFFENSNGWEDKTELSDEEIALFEQRINDYYIIVEPDVKGIGKDELYLTYYIEPTLIKHWSNNTIYASAYYHQRLFEGNNAHYELIFGTKGTNGTAYTLLLRMEQERYGASSDYQYLAYPSAWTINSTNLITLSAKLFDANDLEVEDATYSWSKFSGTGTVQESGQTVDLTNVGNNGVILKCEANKKQTDDTITTQFTGYLIVPVRSDRKYIAMEGPDVVAYDASGTNPKYNKNAYALVDSNKKSIYNNNVSIGGIPSDPDSEINPAVYYPQIIEESGRKHLKPTGMYFHGVDDDNKTQDNMYFGLYINIDNQWYNPLLILVDPYGNRMLNGWNGDLQINEDDNSILAAVIGAGRKEKNNTFTGLLLGDLPKNSVQAANKTGLLGYEHGEQAYGIFDDGTMFLGKSSRAQIRLNGTEGVIQNANYPTSGIKIDFEGDNQKPYIDLQANTGAQVYLGTGGAPTTNLYFRVKSPNIDNGGNNQELIHIGKQEYYLQTDNYSDTNKTGLKIDLKEGSLKSYDKLTLQGGTLGDANSIYLSTNNAPATKINDISKSNWRLMIGSQFGVDANGVMYSNAGHIGGETTLDDNSIIGGRTLAQLKQEADANTKSLTETLNNTYISGLLTSNIGGWQIWHTNVKIPTTSLNADGTVNTTTYSDGVSQSYYGLAHTNTGATTGVLTHFIGNELSGNDYKFNGNIIPTEDGSTSNTTWTMWMNGNFGVTTGGRLYANGAYIKGTIYADAGSIAGGLVTSGIDAGNISTGYLSADRIKASSLTTGKISGLYAYVKDVVAETVTADYITAKHAVLGEMTIYKWGGVSIPDMLVVSGEAYFNSGVSVYGGGTYSGRYFTLSAADIQWIHTQRGV